MKSVCSLAICLLLVILKSSWSQILKSYPEVIPKSSQSHPKVILKSSQSHPDSSWIILNHPESSWSHPEVISWSHILKSYPEVKSWSHILFHISYPKVISWSHPEVILKSSWSHPAVILKPSWSRRCHHEVIIVSFWSQKSSFYRAWFGLLLY